MELQYGKYYHIYNRGNNKCKLFHDHKDYETFLWYCDKFTTCVSELYTYCLMPNHFHLMLRILDENEIGFLDHNKLNTVEKWKTEYFGNNTAVGHPLTLLGLTDASRFDKDAAGSSGRQQVRQRCCPEGFTEPFKSCLQDPSKASPPRKRPIPSKQFSHMFNAYTKFYNRKYNHLSSLFQRNFKRKEINDNFFMRQLVYYIHSNPVHHNYTDDFTNYKWSSYRNFSSNRLTSSQNNFVKHWFGDLKTLLSFHFERKETADLKEIALED